MVKKQVYAPSRGDIVWLDFAPQVGHEQMGRRPALTLSPKEYNEKVGLALFCPITSQKKSYPFEVELPSGIGIEGVVLSDQIKSFDWKVRNAELIVSVGESILNEALAKIAALLW